MKFFFFFFSLILSSCGWKVVTNNALIFPYEAKTISFHVASNASFDPSISEELKTVVASHFEKNKIKVITEKNADMKMSFKIKNFSNQLTRHSISEEIFYNHLFILNIYFQLLDIRENPAKSLLKNSLSVTYSLQTSEEVLSPYYIQISKEKLLQKAGKQIFQILKERFSF